MTEERVSAELKALVSARARDCCEYCRSQARFALQPFSVEHIVPRSREGPTAERNLASSKIIHRFDTTRNDDPDADFLWLNDAKGMSLGLIEINDGSTVQIYPDLDSHCEDWNIADNLFAPEDLHSQVMRINWNLASSHRLSRSPNETRTKNRGVNTGHQKRRVFEGFFLPQMAPSRPRGAFFVQIAFQSKAIGLVGYPSSRPRKIA